MTAKEREKLIKGLCTRYPFTYEEIDDFYTALQEVFPDKEDKELLCTLLDCLVVWGVGINNARVGLLTLR